MDSFNIQMIISPIVGAVIGYFTNWLAIKMLFRPRKEYHVLGVRVPFTPGIIPKEKARLANKLGETVSEHLLTGEVLQEAISNSEISNSLNVLIDNFLLDTKNNNYTVQTGMEKLFKDKSDYYIAQLEELGQIQINNLENNDKIQEELNILIEDNILKYLEDNILKYLKETKINNIPDKLLINIREVIENFRDTYITEDKLSGFITQELEKQLIKLREKDLCLNEIISDKYQDIIKNILSDILKKVPEFIEKTLKSNPELDKSLKNLVSKIIDENLGSFVGIFVSSTKVYESIKNNIINFFKDEEKLLITEIKIDNIANDFLEKKLNDFIIKIDQNDMDKIKDIIVNYAVNYDLEKLTDNVMNLIIKNIKKYEEMSFYELAIKIIPNFDNSLSKIVKTTTKSIIKSSFSKLREQIPQIKEKVLKMEVNVFINKFDDEQINHFKQYIIDFAKKVLHVGSSYIAENINIAQIVETQINAIDIKDAEDIILSVVNRELNAITVLGGALGFILGIVPMFFK